jgi:hypothetical protein
LFIVKSLIANASPIITGTAAPVSVFGRAARTHAFNESFFTSIVSIFKKHLQK